VKGDGAADSMKVGSYFINVSDRNTGEVKFERSGYSARCGGKPC
jgi:hypothetical protein